MAYDQNSAYEAPRRAQYGQPQQQYHAPVQQSYRSQAPQEYGGYDQGYDQGYGGQQQYGGYDEYGQGAPQVYDQRQRTNAGPPNGHGYAQQPQQHDDRIHRQQAPPNGYAQPAQQNGYAPQERNYDPRYQQRPGRGGHAAQGMHSGQRVQQPQPPRQGYQDQASTVQRPELRSGPSAPRAGPPGPTNGYTDPRQHSQPMQRPAERVSPPRTQRNEQAPQQVPKPEPQSSKPKKQTMEEWKAQEKAKLHAAAASPEIVPQDNAFPSFPQKRLAPQSGSQSAMSSRTSDEQGRPSTSSSGRPEDRRPGFPKNNSFQSEAPPIEEASSPQQQQLQRPSIDHQPYSFEPIPDRLPQQRQPQPGYSQENIHSRAGAPPNVRQPTGGNPQQYNNGRDQRQPSQGINGSYVQGGGPQIQTRAPPQMQPIDTGYAQFRRPAAMDHQPLSPAYVPERPSTAQAVQSPLGRQPPQQVYSPASEYSHSASSAHPYHQPAEAFAAQPPPQQGQLNDIYGDYNDEVQPNHAPPVATPPKTREEEIEAEMPDFDSAAPGGFSNLHKRAQTVDKHLNESQPAPAPPMPMFPAQHVNASVQSLPIQSQRVYGQHQGAAVASQPNIRDPEPMQNGIPDGFVFGVPGERVQQQQPCDERYRSPPQPAMSPYNQALPPVQPPFANETQVRRSMDDARQMQMPYRGPPQPQRFHQNGPSSFAPVNRPGYDRQGTAQTVWSDPGQQRVPSAPPLRSAMLQPQSLGQGRPIGAPLVQQRSAPDPSQQRRSNPDALPQHPVPVRPGLIENGQSPPPKPAPVRNYDGASVSSSNSQPRKASLDISDRPVTQAELQQLRAAVETNPNSNKTALLYAKKLVEAASVLASEGGRADAKTTARNRENYILDGHKRIKKLVSAGYPDAQFYLADCYGQGLLGLDVDTKEAFNLYQAAAKAGHGAAAYRTAVCCEMGAEEGGGTRRDFPKAVQWYQRAAALGDVAAMFKLGMIQLKGLLGQPHNIGQAVSWLKRAAERADKDNPHALHELGLLYESGNTNPEVRNKVISDDAYALSLFRQAADLGYKQSQFRLGQAQEYGNLGLPIDNRTSIMWYSKAAAQGDHQAELALSGWYLTGAEGILKPSDTEAYLWARKAAQSEPPLAKAMFAMGYFSEQGIGCPQNMEEARKWYGRAAAYKFPKALERIEELKRSGKGAARPPPVNGKLTRKDQKRDEAECVVM